MENLSEDLLKLGLALVMGAAVGIERELHDKPAGIKTISLVTIAGAMLMMFSMQLAEVAGHPDAIDLSRLAAGVVTGIGFLGAGTIIKNRNQVEGITTAAMIWLMSGVGMALGAGFYALAFEAYVAGCLCLCLDPVLRLVRRLLGRPAPPPVKLEAESEQARNG